MKVATHSAHRKSFGPRAHRSEATKALHVAESMLQRDLEGQAWTWRDDYGVDPHTAYGQLVNALLIGLRKREGLPCT